MFKLFGDISVNSLLQMQANSLLSQVSHLFAESGLVAKIS